MPSLRRQAPKHDSAATWTRSLMKNIVYFDLETQKSADEVGGWSHISRMGLSVGVIYSTARSDTGSSARAR